MSTNEGERSRPDVLLLIGTFVNGASIMVTQVLGSRVLAPFFGVGLFVWSALLVVTLGALALGYYLGGALADRRRKRVVVFGCLLVAGALLSAVPLCTNVVLRFGDHFGIRGGALISALILFGPCLTVMGMVTTTATREASMRSAGPGRTVGLIYSLSTVGGLAGTLLAGFVLVPRWELSVTFAATAAALVVAGLAGLIQEKRHGRAVVALALPVLALARPAPELGERIHLLEQSETLQGRLSVIQDDSRAAPLRLLRLDHSFIGGHWMNDRTPAFGFVHLLEAVRLTRPQGTHLLQIGLGVGSLSRSTAQLGIHSDIVEIDPEVVRLARKYFDYTPTGTVFIEDARSLLRRLQTQYDFIVHDTFTGGSVPEHLLSVEFLELLRARLLPGGVLAVNVVGAHRGPLSPATHAVDRTIRSVFAHVRVFRDKPLEDSPESLSNLIFFGSQASIQFASPERFSSEASAEILSQFARWEILEPFDSNAPVITDAKNPLGRLALPASEAFRDAIRELYPAEFWLN